MDGNEKVDPIRALAALDGAVVQEISNWLVESGLARTSFEDLLSGFCERLLTGGLPVARVMMSMRTLHPSIEALNFIWRPDDDVEREGFQIDSNDNAGWLTSPVRHMVENNMFAIRRRLVGPNARLDFPVLEEFRDQGGTDYYLRGIEFDMGVRSTETTGMICSFLTTQPGGFGDRDIAALDRLLPRLALSMKGALTREIADTVLDTYVGHEAGARIMQGDIHRGSLDVINAVILYADLRDFTSITDVTPRDELAVMLDSYYEAMVPPVLEHGGEVLKYLGDGFLATFRLDDAPENRICQGALQAAYEAHRRVAALNGSRESMRLPTMGLDIAMHMGEVLYGNVGAGDRLDFTVIGPSVNEASRIEQLCKELGRDVLISQTFAEAATLCTDRLIPVGEHALRGVREMQTLYTIEA